MTEQELMDELAGLQQERLALAASLDEGTLQLQRWDKHISLLREMLITRQTQCEQEEKLARMTTAGAGMTATTPITLLGE